ncbi:MAG: PspC domain-containing protein [Gammaproteobacteria bacterium]|nr:PspC domain-containing protein [Gammaproteobacteria bacterium]
MSTPESPTPTSTPKVLRRSASDKVIAGVAGGLGRYLGIDSVIIRIILLILLVAGGSGFLIYLIGWIAIPMEKPGDNVGPATGQASSATVLIGSTLIIIGGFMILNRIVPSISKFILPVIVIIIGLAVIVGGRR